VRVAEGWRRRTTRASRRSVNAREDEFKEFWLERHEARASVEAPGLPVSLLDDDLEGVPALGDCIALGVGEQPVSDAMLLVAGRDEQLLDHDRSGVVAAQGDVAGTLAMLAGNERHVVRQHLEYPFVAPAGDVDVRALR
jgi:hypothetical protein